MKFCQWFLSFILTTLAVWAVALIVYYTLLRPMRIVNLIPLGLVLGTTLTLGTIYLHRKMFSE